MKILPRNLYHFEKMEYYESMNCLIEFEMVKHVDAQMVKKYLVESFILCKQKYPYLRMKFTQNGQFILEQKKHEFNQVDLEFYELTNQESLLEKETMERFNKFGSRRVNLEKSVFNALLYSFENKHFQLFISLNHACKI